MTTEDLDQINSELEAGDTPEQVASRRGMTYFQLRYMLSRVGRIIVTYRRLEVAAPADEPTELAAA